MFVYINSTGAAQKSLESWRGSSDVFSNWIPFC